MRRAAKVDANHGEIVMALRAIGCTVQSLAAVGQGCPDLLLSRDGWTALFEVKDGKNDLNEIQQMWHQRWQGPSFVVRSADEAVRLVQFWTK